MIVMPVRHDDHANCVRDIDMEATEIRKCDGLLCSRINTGVDNHPLPVTDMNDNAFANAGPE